ncbi:MAG: 16S rRNA (cytidine(1402)-2'-O)-methyltransferase [Deltaproteobacteria bacterium]|nr:16S rRNA (cytidine(1402)-2'-O)-methyltransferase [Deltaproteobacteria bacterium]
MPLFVLATPIGTLGDLSVRARELLASADLIAAEDTRVTRKLLSALKIPAPRIVSYRGHEEAQRAEGLMGELTGGAKVVLVSDAGTPAISDPGVHLVRLCHAQGVPVLSAPGPSAMATALSVSGIQAIPATFLGFSPRKPGPLRRWLRDAQALPGAFVYFEAPSRTVESVAAIAELMPDREVCLCRELSKLHEEVRLAPAPALAAALRARETPILGEVALVVGPGEPPKAEALSVGEDSSLGEIAAALAQRWGVSRNEAYSALLKLERQLNADQ